MGLFNRLLVWRRRDSAQSDPKIHLLTQEATRIADQIFKRELVDTMIITNCTVDLSSESPLTKAIDRILELSPEDPDLVFAKAEAHYALLANETGFQCLRKALALSPHHFDANMRDKYFERWENIFSYVSWGEDTRTVPRFMLGLQEQGNAVQIIRDGLRLALVTLMPVSQDDFPSNVVDSKWKPLWVDTPHGPVFEHYVMLKLGTGETRRQELTISPYPIEPVHRRHGNWLIRRACESVSMFIAFNDGADVIYNRRYTFSRPLRATLENIKEKLARLSLPPDHDTKFLLAAQWYMQHSNLDDVKW